MQPTPGPAVPVETAAHGVNADLVLDELSAARACARSPIPVIPYPTAEALGLHDSSPHVGFDAAEVYEAARLATRARITGRATTLPNVVQ